MPEESKNASEILVGYLVREMVAWVGLIVSLRCVFGVAINNKNALAFIILLEASSLGVVTLGLRFYAEMGLYQVGLVLLSVRVCGGAVGLGLLVGYVRRVGNDYTGSSMVLKL